VAGQGIQIVTWADLDQAERDRLSTYFTRGLPGPDSVAVDPVNPFPFVSGWPEPRRSPSSSPTTAGQHFARVKVPDNVGSFCRNSTSADSADVRGEERSPLLARRSRRGLPDVVFPGMEIVAAHAFRNTRNAISEVDEDSDEDLLQAMEREAWTVARFGSPVRIEVADDMTEHCWSCCARKLEVHPGGLSSAGPVDLSSLWQIYGVDRPG